MNEHGIAETLIAQGELLLKAPREFVRFTGELGADKLLNDLENTPHAFVLACVMNRQIRAEKAWLVPFGIAERVGSFDIKRWAVLSVEEIEELMITPQPLHRFPTEMAINFHAVVQVISTRYSGMASLMWKGKPSSAEVVYRFLELRGVGPKIATMAANILARNFKIEFSDYSSVDVSVDDHVRRVFSRLGLIPADASSEQIIYRARSLSPGFPGLLDLPAWEIGRNWCKPSGPNCSACYMDTLCPKTVMPICRG